MRIQLGRLSVWTEHIAYETENNDGTITIVFTVPIVSPQTGVVAAGQPAVYVGAMSIQLSAEQSRAWKALVDSETIAYDPATV